MSELCAGPEPVNPHRLTRPELDVLCRAQGERIGALEGDRVRTNASWNDAFNWLYVVLTNRLAKLETAKADVTAARKQAELNKRNFADMDALCTRAIEQREQARAAFGRYGQHDPHCQIESRHVCECGYLAARRAALAGVAQDAPDGDSDDVKAGDDV